MINQQLLDYIKQSLNQGVSKEVIKNTLLSNGWPMEDIELAFKMILDAQSSIQGPTPVVPHVKVNKILSLGELINYTWHLYRQKFSSLLKITALAATLIYLVDVIFSSNLASLHPNPILVAIVAIINILIQLLETIALIYAVKNNNDNISVSEAYQYAIKKFLPSIWVSILTFAVVLAIPLSFILIGLSLSASSIIPWLIMGALTLIFPGIILTLWFIYGIYAVVIDNANSFSALIMSKNYVEGQVNNVFSRTFLADLLVAVAALPFFFILSLLLLPLAILKIPDVSYLRTIIYGLFATPFLIIFNVFLYNNLKELKSDRVLKETPKEKIILSVLAILGMLTMILVPIKVFKYFSSQLQSMQNEVQSYQTISNLNTLKTAVQYYKSDKGKYPKTLDDIAKAYPDLFSSVPIDPITKTSYYYELINNGTGFKICSGFGTPQENCITGQ